MSDFWESVASGLGRAARKAFIAITDENPEDVFKTSIEPVTEPAKDRAIKTLNADELIRRLDERIPEYAKAVEKRVAEAIRSKETSDLLEIKLYGRMGTMLPNQKQPEYYKFFTSRRPNMLLSTDRPGSTKWIAPFFQYMQDKPEEGFRREAGVELVVSAACSEASEAYFTSAATQSIVSEELSKSARNNGEFQRIVMKELKDTGKLIKREAKDAVAAHGHAVAADRVHDTLHHAVAAASSTTAGAVAGKVIASALALPVVKVAIVKATAVALGSSAVHTAVAAAAKHCGLTTLAICFLGHTTASSIMGVVALPLIAAVIAAQWYTLPDTLAKEMAPKIGDEIRKQAKTINRNIVDKIKEKMVEEILDIPKEMMEKIHEAAMEELDNC